MIDDSSFRLPLSNDPYTNWCTSDISFSVSDSPGAMKSRLSLIC
jgi:hypothetical protein